MCAYSLDHITPSDLESYKKHNQLVLECDTQFEPVPESDIKTNCRILKNTYEPALACHDSCALGHPEDSAHDS